MRQDASVKENKYCQVVSSSGEEVKKRTPARSAQSERGIVTREGGERGRECVQGVEPKDRVSLPK